MEFTPLLGYISWSNFPWIILIMIKKCSYNAQNKKYMDQMAPERPKTPIWTFYAPELAKK